MEKLARENKKIKKTLPILKKIYYNAIEHGCRRSFIQIALFECVYTRIPLQTKQMRCKVQRIFGEFSSVLNSFFPERNLHMFDTFEGFNEADIEVEKGGVFK